MQFALKQSGLRRTEDIQKRWLSLTVGGHKEACVDLSGVAEVRLHLLPTDFEFPLMDASGFDVQHVETYLTLILEDIRRENKE